MDNAECTPFPPVVSCSPNSLYALPGPQVEPDAAYWTAGPCAVPSVVQISELIALTDDPDNKRCYFKPYPCDEEVVQKELQELKELAGLRDDPNAIASNTPGKKRLPISKFLQYRPQPLGAVFCLEREQKPLKRLKQQCTLTEQDNPPVIQTGRELARWFENETPGLAHRHALNCLILSCNLSPPRQARIWMALDVAIYSALLAAWYYKWGSDRPCTVYRPRPKEVDDSIDVLYDTCVNETGCGDDGARTTPMPSPGTPRHPAYPSGHSTYAGAGSEILTYFFPNDEMELDRLADNVGLARLWAGIHYRSDHEQGMKLGRCVARLVISQLESDGVPLPGALNPMMTVPSKAEVRTEAYENRRECLKDPSPKGQRRCKPPQQDPGCEAD
ncbi:MAG: vanadium-dependent haloperoxidase [Rubrobacteraceae bacterium]